MDETDFHLLCAAIACLAIGGILQSKIARRHDEMLVRHDQDITFLRLVTRGLEEKVAD